MPVNNVYQCANNNGPSAPTPEPSKEPAKAQTQSTEVPSKNPSDIAIPERLATWTPYRILNISKLNAR